MQLHNKVSGEELKKQMATSSEERSTLSFYQYANIGNPQVFRDHLFTEWSKLGVLGRTYVAHEGINAQISILSSNKEAFVEQLNTIDFLKDIRLNWAIEDDGKSFFKLMIKVRPKIVADGLDDTSFDVTQKGTHLDAKSFNELTSREDAILVDMRNHYETEVGYFKGAMLPDVDTFRDALPLVEEELADKKDKPLIMYCTGGIRCEKASAYYKHKGFKDVYQLEGGIIEYARQVEQQGLENKFVGKNFVFDERLGERISDEVIAHCHNCGTSCDTHKNCVNDACHLLFIQCEACADKLQNTCSDECADFISWSEEERLKFKKGRDLGQQIFRKGRDSAFIEAYRAYKKD